ncbi:type II toxin-antitoxin system VapC family toxin (plasmid) [Paracoccus liaowanqingii]|uniref:Type II toxin-antitoxin system VapC family toxin n=1 Tax=Paracoccus liaowanqingii TaxID=2560053 RepID=A0A4Y5SSZ8_9RHOB|nr:type II toxin-antitoxin system VapC family toxin [Paracoccus liaowanqingii]QDA36449.1 type II toxin-antitoxin system VapC family toxin [Paracoccus liaowanqingii]
MRLLLDTHILLWAMLDDPRLGAGARAAMDGAEAIHVSAASVWEIAIKVALGKLEVPEDLFDQALAAGVRPLAITWAHARAVERLPAHHADPFDRLLIAQARQEGMVLVSADGKFRAYDVELIAG